MQRDTPTSSSSLSRPPPPAAAGFHDAGGRAGSQANGYQSAVSAGHASGGTVATSDWAASKNKETWNSSRVCCYITVSVA